MRRVVHTGVNVNECGYLFWLVVLCASLDDRIFDTFFARTFQNPNYNWQPVGRATVTRHSYLGGQLSTICRADETSNCTMAMHASELVLKYRDSFSIRSENRYDCIHPK